MARDYYAEAAAIAEGAAGVGLHDLSVRLQDAIAEGFTATEICMRIRSVLMASDTALSFYPDLHARSEALINGIDEALG